MTAIVLSLLLTVPFLAVGQPSPAGPIRYLDPVFDVVQVQAGLTYRDTKTFTGEEIQLELDLYSPKGDNAKKRPAVVWVHGGYMATGSRDGEVEKRVSTSLAKRGYVVASISYRLRPEPNKDFNATIRDCMSDVQSALDWVGSNSTKYGIDSKKIALAGYSAGAEIVTNLTYTNFIKGMDPKKVAGVVAVAGNTLFFSEPVSRIPPCLIVHGTVDDVNPYKDAKNLESRLLKAKVDTTFLSLDGEDHYFQKPGSMDSIERAMAKFLFEKVAKPKSN